MTTLTLNGTRLDVEERGTGAPVVFVHGDISDRRTWAEQLDAFARAGRRAIAYSRRGHWPAPPPTAAEGSKVEAHVADLAAVIEKVAGGRADVVANSYGGYVALALAKERPELVRSLVLCEPAVVPLALDLPPTPEAMAALAARDPPLARAMDELLPLVGAAIERYAAGDAQAGGEMFARYHVPHALAKAGVAQAVRDNSAVHAAALLGGHFSPYSEADARAVQAPTLLVTGARSPPYLLALSERLAKLLPRAEWAQLPEVGHFMHVEDAAAFDKLVLAFLARQR